jgi:predicted esterase
VKAVALGLATTVLVAMAGCKRGSDEGGRAAASDASAAATASPTPDVPSTKSIVLPASELPASHLVVMLHGVGACATAPRTCHGAESFVDAAHTLQAAIPHAEILVPDGFHPFDGGPNGPDAGPGARQWFTAGAPTEDIRTARIREAGNELSRWIDAELGRRRVGGDRLVVVGISQGATVGAWVAVHRNPRPAALVMLSGRIPWKEEDPATPDSATPLPVLIANGGADERNPIEPSATLLEAWGARVTRRVYSGLQHGEMNDVVLRDVKDFLKTALSGS